MPRWRVMAKVSPFVLMPPIIFAAVAGLFLGGMFRENPDELPSTLVGRAAPEVELANVGALPKFDVSLLGGEGPKIVNFWASWCGPCRIEHDQLVQLSEEGIPVYGVNYKDDERKALGFLDELGNPYRAVGADKTGDSALDWGVYGVPETFVIDEDGKVVLRFAGPVTKVILEKRIRPALAGSAERPDDH